MNMMRIVALVVIGLSLSWHLHGQEVHDRKGFNLTVLDKSPDLDPVVKERLIETFFSVYPVLTRYYNPSSVKGVEFFIDPTYNGVAEAGGKRVRISPQWLKTHPDDFDLVTHELMHLVQCYPHNAGPWWITEGIADYVRYVFGVDNELGGWSLPDLKPDHNYDSGYRITARFMVWIENHVQPGTVKRLDHAMRSNLYNPGLWNQLTGKNVQELWDHYKSNPTIN